MKKRRLTLIIIGLLLLLIPYFINVYSVLRLLSIIIGLIFLITGLILNKKDKAIFIVIYPILFLVLAFFIDYGVVNIFKNIPIFSNIIESSNKVITYNSIFYRVYSCNKKIRIDNLYKLEYACGESDIAEHNINDFLQNSLDNYQNFKDKFIKLSGKISKINGTYNLELQSYTQTDDSINGYVVFDDAITVEVNFNEIKDLTKYKLYDNITIIGRVDKLSQSFEKYTLKLSDSIILKSNLYNQFEITITPKKNCELDKVKYEELDDITYYTSCIDEVFIKYDDENIYELSYELLDKRIDLKKLIEKSLEKEEGNGNILYTYDNFKALKCANEKEVIIGNKKLTVDSSYCEVEVSIDEEL